MRPAPAAPPDRLPGRPVLLGRAPPGFLGQCVKGDEGANLARTLALAGRADDVVRVTADPGCPWRADPLALAFGLRGATVAGVAKLVAQLAPLVDRYDARQGGDQFWRVEAERLVYYGLASLAAAYDRPRTAQLHDWLASAPAAGDFASGRYDAGFCGRTMALAASRNGGRYPREFDRAINYVTREFPGLPDRTRESIRPHAVQVAFPFTVPPVCDLCAGETLDPGMLAGGACVLLDVPVLRYGLGALLWQAAFKCVCDLALTDRPAPRLPVVAWADEYQWLCLPDWDLKVTTVAAEFGYHQVRLYQDLRVLYAALGGGPNAENQAAALLSNSPLVVWHCSVDEATCRAASARCGEHRELFFGGSAGGRPYDAWADWSGAHVATAQCSFQEQVRPRVPPEALARLRRGGRAAGFVCDALVTRVGGPHAFAAVPQVLLAEESR